MVAEHRNISWIYQARRVCTQTNAAGGALIVRVSLASGQIAKLRHAYLKGTASGACVPSIYWLDEDGANGGLLATAVAGANKELTLPSIGSAATATVNVANTTDMLLPSGGYLYFTGTVAAQTETIEVYVVLELFNLPTTPTWDTTGSAGTPSLAASTISAANTLTAGRIWT